ncbi:MAG: poly[(R)-3-hydroxyalkanoate] polymerase subunit PhaC [Frankiales bacterium]|jgi:polyhydroxyalkanoate synthase|nr:poly[(R)-3-hydroxyalkanoate] polymerase subunit PhaC [Frankiales bacterium]
MTVRSETTDVAGEAVAGGEDVTLPDVSEVVGGITAVLSQGRSLRREGVELAKELGRISVGRSEIAPHPADKRFKDAAWENNPVFHRIEQSYLAGAQAIQNLLDDLETSVDEKKAESARFALTLLTSAAAPTNFLATNPSALKKLIDTGGQSVVRGARNFVHDMRHNGGLPSMSDPDAFEVGRNLAVTPGVVVGRDEVGELLQYAATTETVYQRPVLVVPPPIGRFYFLDLSPGRSFAEFVVGQGMQTFMLSWRNPTVEQGDWTLDTYAARVSRAIDTVREITGADDVNVIGFCAGGMITTALLSHLAATGDNRIHSMSYAVTMLDFGARSPITAFAGRGLLAFAKRRSSKKGIITSRQMGSAFTLLRPDDLVFNYWVNNYLMGEKPPAFDVLAWNADGTNLPGALHGQFLEIFRDNPLIHAGGIEVLGTPVDVSTVKVPTFVTGAVSDHLTPWKSCYQTTQLVSGESTFVLSYSGHIASLVNPPGNPKAHYWTGGEPGADPDAWLAGAERKSGSWWEAWMEWLGPKSGDRQDAAAPGSETHPALGHAPGLYVRDELPA